MSRWLRSKYYWGHFLLWPRLCPRHSLPGFRTLVAQHCLGPRLRGRFSISFSSWGWLLTSSWRLSASSTWETASWWPSPPSSSTLTNWGRGSWPSCLSASHEAGSCQGFTATGLALLSRKPNNSARNNKLLKKGPAPSQLRHARYN